MTLKKIKMVNFTAFNIQDITFSPGINVLIGTNGTGKTHLMKILYSACDVSKSKINFADKLIRVFLPSGGNLGRLVKRKKGSEKGRVLIYRENSKLIVSFSNHSTVASSAKFSGKIDWLKEPIECVYIPVKEMLSNAPGFRSLYSQREIHFEEIYSDILDRAYLPPQRGPINDQRKELLKLLQKVMDGKVIIKDEEFFLRNKQGNLEFTLLAEGIRKLGLLWLLIQNGTLLNGSVLFWDEPETNLNPKLYGTLMEILLSLQRIGVQIFIATHDYVILKELDLQMKQGDQIKFHSLYRDNGEIVCNSTSDYLSISPNAIADTFSDLYDREVTRSLGGLKI